MAHFALLWKARTIEKHRRNYENEKINSIIMSSSEVPDKTLFQRWRHYKHGMRKRLSRTFSKWYPEGGTVSNFFVNLRADMRLPSILLRSLYGFIGGLLLTYLAFMFFVFQLSVSEMHATVLSSIIGVLLTLGLTFSNRMRCLIFLLVPQLFSRVGRYTLTCYALVLILTGPATNTLRNSEILSESMACSQEQIKLSVRQINDSIKKPSNSIKDSLKLTIERMNLVVKKLKTALIKINKLILSIATIIQSGYSWLNHMADTCNEALGAPRQICLSILKECDKNNENYNFNPIKADVKKYNTNFVRDLLHAIGVKNVKHPHEETIETELEKNEEKNNVADKNNDAKHDKTLKILNTANRNTKESRKGDKVNKLKNIKTEKLRVLLKDNIPESVCNSLQSYKKFCVPADFVGDTFLATIRKKLKTFVHRISELIHVKLNIEHTYTFIGNSSTSNQIAAGIVTEIRNRADPLLTWLSWSSCVTSLFLLLIIFRAKHYQHMFETRSRFDNRFITKEFRELDLKRLREGRETVLPMNTRERAKYVTTTSFRLVASEKLYLNRSAVFMTVATFKLLIHVVADYSLFWVLATIRHHGTVHSTSQSGTKGTGTTVTGSGFVTRLLQAFINTMEEQLSFPPPDQSCLPNPYPPDIKRYCQIGFLIFLLWFFALLEPYGLRLRHLIMGHHRPQRAKDRAAWLYNHVLRTRASFMKIARRKLHREFKYSSHSKLTVRHSLLTCAPLRWLSSVLGIKPAEPRCLLCNVLEVTGDHNKELIKCEVPNCPGCYCPPCFSDIGQLCTICLSPSDYGDYSDVSLQNWTSDEENSDDDINPDDFKSNTRKTNSDFYTLEDENNTDGEYSKRSTFNIRRKLSYFVGRSEKKGSDTLPLLKHSIDGVNNVEEKTFQNQVTNGTDNLMNLQENTEHKIRQNKHNDAIPKKLNKNHMISAIDLLLYSLYEITKNPLQITKSKYTTNIAKFLRRRKLIRHKRCIQGPSKYFMTCSYNNIYALNENLDKGDATIDQNNDRKYLKNTCNELKDFSNNNVIESLESNNEKAFSIVKSINIVNNGEFNSAFFKYWNNVKSSVLKDKTKTKPNEKLRSSKHLRKRKKKRKKIQELTSKRGHPKLNEKEEQIGNSRLFAFLDDKDWANCGNSIDNKVTYIAERDIDRKYIDKGDIVTEDNAMKDKEINENNKIIISGIIIPKLELNLSSESDKNLQMFKGNEQNSSSNTIKRRNTTRIIGKIFKIITCSSCKFHKGETTKGDLIKDIYCKATGDYYRPVEKREQHSADNVKANVCGEISAPPPPPDTTSKENVTRRLVRLSYPIFIIRNHFSLIFSRNKKRNDDTVIEKNPKSFEEPQDLEVTEVKPQDTEDHEGECKKPMINAPCKERIKINAPYQVPNTKFEATQVTEDRGCESKKPITNVPCEERVIINASYTNFEELQITDHHDCECTEPFINSPCEASFITAQCGTSYKALNKAPLTKINEHELIMRNKIVQCKIDRQTKVKKSKFVQILACEKETQTEPKLIQTGNKEVTAFPQMISRCCPDSSCSDEPENYSDELKFYRHKKNKRKCKDYSYTQCHDVDKLKRDFVDVALENTCSDLRQKEDVGSNGSSIETIVFYDDSATDTTVFRFANMDYNKTYRDAINHKLRSPVDKRSEEPHTSNRHGTRFKQDCSNGIPHPHHERQIYQYPRQTKYQCERVRDRNDMENLNLGKKAHCRFKNETEELDMTDRFQRMKVKVVTKSNQSTLTDKANHCDVSTATYDWWSPLVEKRNIKKAEKRRKDCGLARVRERRTVRNKGVSTTEKIVSFKSTTQLIPADSVIRDIMSPARYLLESQKYYNELFNDKFGSPRVYPVTNLQRNCSYERERSQNNRRRGRKPKRLEESYSPRKDIQPNSWKRSKVHEKFQTITEK